MTNQPVGNIWYNSCPRCRGSRYRDGDYCGEYLLCVSCGPVTYPFKAPERPSRMARQAIADAGRLQPLSGHAPKSRLSPTAKLRIQACPSAREEGYTMSVN